MPYKTSPLYKSSVRTKYYEEECEIEEEDIQLEYQYYLENFINI
jgi:hypothetical protein